MGDQAPIGSCIDLAKLSEGREPSFALRALKLTLHAFGLLFSVALLAFVLFSVLPSDPARVMLGPNASEETVANLRGKLGLDVPAWLQLTRHIERLAVFDLGKSIVDGRSVRGEVFQKFGVTIGIGFQAALIALIVSYLLNLVAFLHPIACPLLSIVRLGVVAPAFLVASAGALFIGYFFPSVSLSATNGSPFAPIIPSVVAAFYPIALMTMVLRDRIESSTRSSYFRAGIASGHSEMSLFHRYLICPAAVPWLAAWVNQLSLIFFATLVLELIFSVSGSGVLLVNTIQQRDFPMLQGVLLVNAAFFITLSTVSEILFAWIDPRI